jgi:hypothetical protein
MKKIFLLTMIVASMIFLTSCEKETVLSQGDIPSEIKTYVSTHFPSQTILQVIKDRDGTELTYDVILSGNVTLEFNRKKEIIDISSNSKLPDSVIPEKILLYVNTNYPDNYITDWEKTGKKNQKIELDNKLELEFDKSGNFLRFDD